MKIERSTKEPPFEPITVILETRQEAEWLMTVCNRSDTAPSDRYPFTDIAYDYLESLGFDSQEEDTRLAVRLASE